jgi:hypothetical protein
MAQVRSKREDRIDEPVRFPVDLSLRERPELDRLHPTGQCVRQSTQAQDASGSRKQKPTRAWIGVDCLLDGQQKLRDPLHLIDDHGASTGDELCWVIRRCLARCCPVKTAPLRAANVADLGHQGALPALPGTVDEDHPSVVERFLDNSGCLAWEDAANG